MFSLIKETNNYLKLDLELFIDLHNVHFNQVLCSVIRLFVSFYHLTFRDDYQGRSSCGYIVDRCVFFCEVFLVFSPLGNTMNQNRNIVTSLSSFVRTLHLRWGERRGPFRRSTPLTETRNPLPLM